MTAELPQEARAAAERLTHHARNAEEDSEREAYRERRADLLAEHGFTARVREDDTREVLVLHPAAWTEDGTIRVDRVDDLDRAVEIPLSGPGEAADWDEIDAHNREIAARVERETGAVHGANASAFADFMSNHRARPVESATPGEVEEFLSEYFPRNAWPTDEQRAVVERSVELVIEAATSGPEDGTPSARGVDPCPDGDE